MPNAQGPGNNLQTTFTQLVETYQKPLLNLCYMYLRDRALAEDAVQDSFLKAYRALAAFRGDCSPKSWLMRIAVNTCRDMQRSAWFTHMNRRITPEELPIAAQEEDAEASGLADAIMCLPGRYKEVILLYYYERMTMPEIADTLGVNASTVSRRIKTACAKLHAALGKEDAHG